MKSVSGRDFARLVERRGWTLLRINGSHHIYGRAASTVRLSIRWFKRTGAGYQSRIGDVLKRHVSRQSAARKKKVG